MQLRNFATSLHFCSAKAYDFVRKAFNNTLPHPRTLTRWYVTVNGDPGITKESLEVLRGKAATNAEQGKELLGILLMDEVGMRQQVKWDRHATKLNGKVQKEFAKSFGEVEAAKEALMFMVTGVEEPFKIPVGYFLINGISAEAKRDLVNTVLIALHEAGVKIIAFVFDGTQTNITTANLLGCHLKISPNHPMVTKFEHPCGTHDVHVLLDIVHMLKLIRNTLHKRKVILTPDGEAKWEFLEKLNNFQKEKGVKLGNKLSDNHIHFTKSKMKVIYAVQTISNGCAHALEVLQPLMAEFADCHAMVKFLRTFNNLFDVFNSMKEDSTGFKEPLTKENFENRAEMFKQAEQYIRDLKFEDGSSVVTSKNRTGFLGFIVAMHTFTDIFRTYSINSKVLLKIFTYRFSQDHLEIFFGTIRSKSGCNNNPNADQLKAIYKRLIKNNQIISSAKANCTDFDQTINLTAQHVEEQTASSSTAELQTAQHVAEQAGNLSLVLLREQALQIKAKILSKLICPTCSSNYSDLPSIIAICEVTERIFLVSYILSCSLNN